MTMTHRLAIVTTALLSIATPSTAQSTWMDDLEAQLQKHTEALAQLDIEGVVTAALQSGKIEAALARAQETVERQRQRAQDQRRAQREALRRREERLPEFTEAYSRTIRTQRDGEFDLTHTAGDIVITGGGGTEVKIEAVKRVRRANEREARTILQQIDVRVIERDGRVAVETQVPARRMPSATVDYTITVPSNTNVSVRTTFGNLRVSNVKGGLRVDATNGDVAASRVERVRTLRSTFGDIEVADAETDDLSLATIGGDIVVRNLRAGTLDAQTVGGNLQLTAVRSDRVSLKSTGGKVEYDGPLMRRGRFEVRTHSGDVRLTFADNPGFELEATTFSGDVRSDFPLTLQGRDVRPGQAAALRLDRRERGLNRAIRGVVGDAGATLSITTFSGDIAIIKR